MSIIDITLPLYEGMVAWPGSIGLTHQWVKRIERGDSSNDSVIKADIHLGTHVDAPLHFIDDGESVEKMALEVLCGPAFVVELCGVAEVGSKELNGLELPEDVTRLLIKTDNSRYWGKTGEQRAFKPDFVALTEDGARWLVDRGIRLVGIDYLSVGPYPDGSKVHRELLGAGLVLLEGINLFDVSESLYELTCLPLKIRGAEGAPARAVLRTIDGGTR